MGQAQVVVIARSGLGHGYKLPSKNRRGGDVRTPGARGSLADASQFLRFLGLQAGISAEQTAQGGEACRAGGTGMAGLNPSVHTAVDGGGIVLAAAFTGLCAGLQIGERVQDPVRIDVGQAERADPRRVNDPAPGGCIRQLESKG
jgi:hypothetical protein